MCLAETPDDKDSARNNTLRKIKISSLNVGGKRFFDRVGFGNIIVGMDDNPIENYNSPKPADVWRMKEECHQYYIGCFNRFKCGEQFHPNGFARIDYASTVRQLVRTLHFLGSEQALFGWKRLLRLHFNLHFTHVHVSLADWNELYHVTNFWEFETDFKVYEVKGLLVRREEGKKCRYVILQDNRVVQMDTALFLRQFRESDIEQPFPSKLQRSDWQLALNREVADFYCAANSRNSKSTSAAILTFPTPKK